MSSAAAAADDILASFASLQAELTHDARPHVAFLRGLAAAERRIGASFCARAAAAEDVARSAELAAAAAAAAARAIDESSGSAVVVAGGLRALRNSLNRMATLTFDVTGASPADAALPVPPMAWQCAKKSSPLPDASLARDVADLRSDLESFKGVLECAVEWRERIADGRALPFHSQPPPSPLVVSALVSEPAPKGCIIFPTSPLPAVSSVAAYLSSGPSTPVPVREQRDKSRFSRFDTQSSDVVSSLFDASVLARLMITQDGDRARHFCAESPPPPPP